MTNVTVSIVGKQPVDIATLDVGTYFTNVQDTLYIKTSYAPDPNTVTGCNVKTGAIDSIANGTLVKACDSVSIQAVE